MIGMKLQWKNFSCVNKISETLNLYYTALGMIYIDLITWNYINYNFFFISFFYLCPYPRKLTPANFEELFPPRK